MASGLWLNYGQLDGGRDTGLWIQSVVSCVARVAGLNSVTNPSHGVFVSLTTNDFSLSPLGGSGDFFQCFHD